MKKEYLEIELLMSALLGTKHESDFPGLIIAIHNECQQHYLRFEVLYGRTFYQTKIYESQQAIQQHVQAQEYELAALKRDSKLLYQFKVQQVDRYFPAQSPPTFNIDVNGLIRCLLDYHEHESLIAKIVAISKM